MKTIIKIFVVTLFSVLLWSGCSSSLPEVKDIKQKSDDIYLDSLRINTKEVYSWVNRMPGRKPRFHVTGNIQIFEDSKYVLENLSIENIEVKQNNNTIYKFSPKIESKYVDSYKTIVFTTVRGMLLSSILDVDKTVNIVLKLSDSATEFEYTIDEIEIEEVY